MFQGPRPLVRLVPDSPRVGAVTGSAFCDLSVAARDGNGVVLTALDNLCKGMATQAIQSMNLALGQPETQGLLHPRPLPGLTAGRPVPAQAPSAPGPESFRPDLGRLVPAFVPSR